MVFQLAYFMTVSAASQLTFDLTCDLPLTALFLARNSTANLAAHTKQLKSADSNSAEQRRSAFAPTRLQPSRAPCSIRPNPTLSAVNCFKKQWPCTVKT